MTTPTALRIYDTTLRDATQRMGLTLSVDDKLQIAQRLDRLGVAYIAGGWPGADPKDRQFFERALDMEWQTAQLTVLGGTARVGIPVEDDPDMKAMLATKTPVCTLVGKSWTVHVNDIGRATLDENLERIEQSIAYLMSHGRRVIFNAQHFFDGYSDDPTYAVEALRAAARGGAEALVLCDSNGGSLPWRIETIVRNVHDTLGEQGSRLGIYAYDDSGAAVANTLAAVRGGARHVQGTVNGYGERCGSANLCAVLPNLELKMDFACLPKGKLADLSDVSHFVAEVANLTPDNHMAYVGRNAFAHKGGLQLDPVRLNQEAYQHINPNLVGNERRVVVSELSGRDNVLSKAAELGLNSVGDATGDADVDIVLDEIRANENMGFCYEAAEASMALLLIQRLPTYMPPFKVLSYVLNVHHRDGYPVFSEATLKVEVGGEVVHTAAEGNGPIRALDQALRKALLPIYPELQRIMLSDYKVRVINNDRDTSAIARVLINSTDGERQWGTVGASINIIEASWKALADAVEYGLYIQKHGSDTQYTDSKGQGTPPKLELLK